MTNDRFDTLIKQTTETRLSLGVRKGAEYANSEDDRLANFKKVATELGQEPEQVLMTYSMKHWLGICRYVRKLGEGFGVLELDDKSAEPIEGRIDDLQNYMDLLRGLLAERREAVK